MTPAENQSAWKAVNDGKRVVQILREEHARREWRRRLLKSFDLAVGVTGAIVVFIPGAREFVGERVAEVAIALPPAAIIATSVFYTLTKPGDPARLADHAADLAYHVAQLEAALEAATIFSSNERAISQAKITVQSSIRAAVDKWPELLKEFA